MRYQENSHPVHSGGKCILILLVDRGFLHPLRPELCSTLLGSGRRSGGLVVRIVSQRKRNQASRGSKEQRRPRPLVKTGRCSLLCSGTHWVITLIQCYLTRTRTSDRSRSEMKKDWDLG